MGTFQYAIQYNVYDYSGYDKTKIPLKGEIRYFDTVITGQLASVHIIGDGTSAVNALPFSERVEISTGSNVDLEDLRITGNKVKIFNSGASTITIQTGTTASPKTENLNTKSTVKAFFDGTYWRVEDGGIIGEKRDYHQSLLAGLSVPWGWALCDGTVISDAESPLNGKTIPDLNGEGRFIRGGDTSGTEQDDAMQRITGVYFPQQTNVGIASGVFSTGAAQASNRATNSTGGCAAVNFDSADSTSPNPAKTSDTETRPINMSMVMIIKYK